MTFGPSLFDPPPPGPSPPGPPPPGPPPPGSRPPGSRPPGSARAGSSNDRGDLFARVRSRAPARAEGPGYALFQLDAVEWLKSLSDESVDLVITDPPYESLEVHRAVGTTTRLKHSKASSNDWFQIFPNRRFPELFAEIFRVLKRNAHFYLFCDQETLFVAKPAAEAAGFRFWKPLVWDKQKIGMGYHYRARYEFILFFEKGKRRLNDLSIPDVIAQPRIRGRYPAEKPADVSKVLVVQSTDAEEVVVDPFMGSGSVGAAAMDLGRMFRGNDLSSLSLELVTERLARVASAPGGVEPSEASSSNGAPSGGP